MKVNGVILIVLVIIILMLGIGYYSYHSKNTLTGLALSPTVSVEGSVVSIEYDLPEGCNVDFGCDAAIITIEDINRSEDPNNFVNVSLGENRRFIFTYGSRPAVLRYDITGTTQTSGEGSSGVVSYKGAPQYKEVNNGVTIYHQDNHGKVWPDVNLPGFKVGDKIKFRFSSESVYWARTIYGQTPTYTIDKYQVIN